jgi:ubiquinone/menaquinone biosynthesis C-methylase UbiE
VTSNLGYSMSAEFDTVAEWTAEVAASLGSDYFIPAGCRGSGHPSWLDWLLDSLGLRDSDMMIDVGAGVGGPAAYATERAGVRPILLDPEHGACRAARKLFHAPVAQADATALPFADAAADVTWCLGVLCTASGDAQQLAMLRELGRVVRPAGRIGLLVFLATAERLDDPPRGNHFPTSDRLNAVIDQAGLAVDDRVSPSDLRQPSQDWADRVAAVEHELQRRFQHTPQLSAANEQSSRIRHLLDSGQVTPELLRLRRR